MVDDIEIRIARQGYLSPTTLNVGVMTTTQPTSLVHLPVPLLSHILGFLALDDQPKSFYAALLACKSLHQAGEAADHSKLQLRVSNAKLQLARQAGQERQLLAYLRRTAHIWRKALVMVAVDKDPPQQTLQQLLCCLAPVDGHGLTALKLSFGGYERCSSTITISYIGTLGSGLQELTAFTTLTALSVRQSPCYAHLPAAELAGLSTVTALRSIKLEGKFSSQLPPQAFNQLQQLTRLELKKINEPIEDQLGWDHLSACRELRLLSLRCAVPCLSGEQALAVWQHLQQLSIWPACSCANAGFWHILPQLASLTKLAISCSAARQRELSQLLSNVLPACLRLADLKPCGYNRPALPQLATTLTWLYLEQAMELQQLPSADMLRSLGLKRCRLLGDAASGAVMRHLTALQLVGCDLQRLPPDLTAPPAVEMLDLSSNELSDLPQQLACLPCLRKLLLRKCKLRQVPLVLGCGLAVRLEHLNLSYNENLVITDEGLEVVSSLTALTYLNLHVIGGVTVVGGFKAVRHVLPASCVLAT